MARATASILDVRRDILYNYIKSLNYLFLPKSDLDGEAMGVSYTCRQYNREGSPHAST
jgi:hypothetical protein